MERFYVIAVVVDSVAVAVPVIVVVIVRLSNELSWLRKIVSIPFKRSCLQV